MTRQTIMEDRNFQKLSAPGRDGKSRYFIPG